MTDFTTTLSVQNTNVTAPVNTVAPKLTTVNNLRAAYYTAINDQSAAWTNYSNGVDQFYAGKITRPQMEELYQIAHNIDTMVTAHYLAWQNATAEYLSAQDCGCVMDQSCPICRATARQVWGMEA